MTVEQIMALVAPHPTRFCVVTGGEPMIAAGIHDLTARLHAAGKHVTIETAGTVPPEGIACDLASISPKTGNSTPGDEVPSAIRDRHERTRMNLSALRAWADSHDCQFKFVIQSCADVDEVVELIPLFGQQVPPERVLLMPEGTTVAAMRRAFPVILDACKQHGFRYCDRLQIRLFGNKRKT